MVGDVIQANRIMKSHSNHYRKLDRSVEKYSAFFSEKRKITNKITNVDEYKTVISDDQLISKELNQFFKNTTKSLNVRQNSYLIDKSELSDQGRLKLRG